MSDGQPQPELRWAPLPPKPSRAGRIWLIVGIAVAVLVALGIVLFFLLPRGAPAPSASSSPSPSATQSATPTPTPTPTPEASASETPAPPQTPVTTPPPVVDPSIESFRGLVSGWLDDALTGLDIAAATSGPDALAVLESLQADAQRLGETVPPSSIATQWQDGVGAYYQRLNELKAALSAGSGTGPTIDGARSAATTLRELVGL